MMQLRSLVGILLAVPALAQTYTYPDCVDGLLSTNGVCDMSLSPSERAAALVTAMNTTEKLGNLVRSAEGAPRIGLPPYNFWNEALHGIAFAPGLTFANSPPFDHATSFPMPLLMAAAFDDDLIQQIAQVIGIEARAWANHGFSGLDYWTPNVNPFKDPRWGRGSETPGEDALRTARYAGAFVRGMEGDETERRIIATLKHWVGYDLESWKGTTRHDFDAKITAQDLAEYYLLPFQTGARDFKAGSIMCSYNAVNGVPVCASSFFMDTILREHWGWTESANYITSDCEAVLDVSANHHYASSNAEGTALCFIAGMDTSCEYESSSDIPGAWNQGLLNETVVDRALKRLYEGLVRVGYFDGDKSEYATLGWSDVNTPQAQDLALQAAVDGIVMLKNDDTLPLKLDDNAKLAMIGFWADDPSEIIGGYSGSPPFTHTPVYAAKKMGFTVNTASGPILQEDCSNDTWTGPALAAAEKSDFIIYFGGLDDTASGEQRDRVSIEWPRAQRALLKSLTKLGKPIVVVQLGDQIDNTRLLEKDEINSILWTSWPGQDGGTAIMQLLTGSKAPAGRLPVTQYPASYIDEIPMTDMNLRPVGSYPGRTYRWYKKPVQQFGFGLHYTKFEPSFGEFPSEISIQELVAGCDNEYPDTCKLPPLQVKITNSGHHKSDYVALAFVTGEYGPKPYPIKTLVTYGRVRDIEPGQTASKDLSWSLGDLSRYDEDGNTVLYPGTYKIMLDEPVLAEMEITLTGQPAVLQKFPALPN